MEERVKYSIYLKSKTASKNWLMINQYLDEKYYVYKLDKTIKMTYRAKDGCIQLYMFKSLPDDGYICIFRPKLWIDKLNILVPQNVTDEELFFIVATEFVERFGECEIF